MISQITKDLFNMQDVAYRDFHSRLIPTVEKQRIIGVRTPMLRKYAKAIISESVVNDFLHSLPHYYYEENNLHAFLIEKINDFDTCIELLDTFLVYVDNWATCDMMNPCCFKKNLDKLYRNALNWLNTCNTYKIRFAIVILMKYYLDDEFDNEYLLKVSEVNYDNYYVYMAKAWYFAEALVKQYDVAVKYFEKRILSRDVHNKAIQKAVESLRISPEIKQYLKSLKY